MSLFEQMKDHYTKLWSTMKVTNNIPAIGQRVNVILANKARYQKLAEQLNGMPWYLIGCIHSLEASCSFAKHLHNGDPLTAKTVQVPKGRPLVGTPPFTWEASALDALRNIKGFHKIGAEGWTPERMLFELEGYNGYGYWQYHRHVNSPYLWSFTNHYTKGKYVADGKWSETAVSQQIGAAILLKELIERDKAAAQKK